MSTPSMKPFLDSTGLLKTVMSEAEKNSDAARVLTADLTEGQLNWKPSTDQWSMSQSRPKGSRNILMPRWNLRDRDGQLPVHQSTNPPFWEDGSPNKLAPK